MRKLARLEIFGPYPPPIGGISVHIQRVEPFLREAGISYIIHNHGSVSTENVIATNKSVLYYLKLLFRNRASVMHFHQFFKFHYYYYFFRSLLTRQNVVVTIHEENLLSYHPLEKKIIVSLLRRSRIKKIVSVSDKLSQFLTAQGVANEWLPAYIPPSQTNDKRLKPIGTKKYFMFSLWKVEESIAENIYNVRLAFGLLKSIHTQYHMLFMIGTEQETDKSYLSRIISEFDIFDSITIVYEEPLIDYLCNCEFILRTNKVDGFGVSLQEALDLGVAAIASDVCVRPKGTILFKNNDIDDLLEKINNLDTLKAGVQSERPAYHLRLLEIYQSLIN